MSLHNDHLTEEKIQINIYANPSTTFLAATNATVEEINKTVVQVLFANERPLCYVINGLQSPMAIYKHMTVIITENRYFFYSSILIFKTSLIKPIFFHLLFPNYVHV